MAWECGDCYRTFATWRSREQHVDALGHTPIDVYCSCCNCPSPNVQALREHMMESHHYCHDCKREFMNANNLKMHLNSRIHRGNGIHCPFCKTGYTTATGLAHHLERGGCPQASFLNRDEVYKVVRAKDPGGIISKKLIGWHGSPTYEATHKAWNGDAYECYMCHREFMSLNSLNQHLSSPAHQQALYHCPNRMNCGREFKTLAAIMNHLESESCAYMRFETVRNTLGNIISGDRRLTFR
ncbi:putative zinc finger protein [Hypoxylon sp. EC38]|nr:putative zinc finger protein [Hypoxylon sp. EC38]